MEEGNTPPRGLANSERSSERSDTGNTPPCGLANSERSSERSDTGNTPPRGLANSERSSERSDRGNTPPCGLANLGNTCCINTLIQCLGHCPSFRKKLIAQCTYPPLKKNRYCLFTEIRRVLIQLWVDRTALAPVRLIKAVYETLDLVPREQQDFSELWMRLISQMMEESHDNDTICGHLSAAQWIGSNRVTKHIGKLALRAWETYAKNNKSMLVDLCHGTQVQQIKCLECGKTYHNVEPIVSTYVELCNAKLGSCLERLHQPECINDWTCDACGKKRAERVLRFWNLGEVWVIILKRFDHEKKISVPVDIMNCFEIGVMEFDQPVGFELCAMANHFGSLHGGHYTAVCKGERGVWYHVDDTGVSEVQDIGRVLTGNMEAYALFYQRVS